VQPCTLFSFPLGNRSPWSFSYFASAIRVGIPSSQGFLLFSVRFAKDWRSPLFSRPSRFSFFFALDYAVRGFFLSGFFPWRDKKMLGSFSFSAVIRPPGVRCVVFNSIPTLLRAYEAHPFSSFSLVSGGRFVPPVIWIFFLPDAAMVRTPSPRPLRPPLLRRAYAALRFQTLLSLFSTGFLPCFFFSWYFSQQKSDLFSLFLAPFPLGSTFFHRGGSLFPFG